MGPGTGHPICSIVLYILSQSNRTRNERIHGVANGRARIRGNISGPGICISHCIAHQQWQAENLWQVAVARGTHGTDQLPFAFHYLFYNIFTLRLRTVWKNHPLAGDLAHHCHLCPANPFQQVVAQQVQIWSFRVAVAQSYLSEVAADVVPIFFLTRLEF